MCESLCLSHATSLLEFWAQKVFISCPTLGRRLRTAISRVFQSLRIQNFLKSTLVEAPATWGSRMELCCCSEVNAVIHSCAVLGFHMHECKTL